MWHGAFNFATGCVTCKSGIAAAVVSALVMVWAVVVVVLFGPAKLSHRDKPAV